jgi:hypothetical protein
VECPIQVKELLDRKFRLNPAYQFIPFELLSEEDRRRFGVTAADTELSGVLVPAAPGLSVKAVCANTATLLQSLRVAGPLPEWARQTFAQSGRVLVRLVLDSVLEVQAGQEFVSGASAGKVVEITAPDEEADTRPARLSIDALQYAQALECGDAPALSARIYFYNRLPASPRWTRRIESGLNFMKYLGMEAGTAVRGTLDREWHALDPSPENPGWLSWRSRDRPLRKPPYKLYLSPICEDLREVLHIALPIVTSLRLPAFKMGRDPYGILRPDKLVVYVPTFGELEVAAAALLSALSGARAHAVPFTAAIDKEGLLSWGMDPPRSEQLSTWQGTSWRRWITDRLATALLTAKGTPGDSELQPWQFAIRRLGIEGINTKTWSPEDVEWAWRKT